MALKWRITIIVVVAAVVILGLFLWPRWASDEKSEAEPAGEAAENVPGVSEAVTEEGGREGAADEPCEFSKSEASRDDIFDQVLVDYFRAINEGDYAAAFGYLSDELQADYGTDAAGQAVDPLTNFGEILRSM